MKKKFSKRILSIVLAVMMIVTAIPFTTAIDTFAATATSKSGAYLMVYFTGEDDGEQLCFAVSRDGYNFEPLNGQNPIVTGYGTGVGTEHMRDPYVFRGHDDGKYYIVATDLNANKTGYSNNALYIWESTDLVSWSIHSHINMSNYIPNTSRAWAPQVLWDDNEGKYMIYWANQQNSGGTTILYYAYTTDLATLTTPQVLFDPALAGGTGTDAIDGDIIFDEKTGTYYLYYKDETLGAQPGIHMCSATAPNGPYTYLDAAIGAGLLPKDAKQAAREGCQMYNISGTDTWIMIADAYRINPKKFYMYSTSDFTSFMNVPEGEYSINDACDPRHGSIMQITIPEYDALCAAYGKATATQSGLRAGEDPLSLLIARYYADYDDVNRDCSGNGNTLYTVDSLGMTVSDNVVAANFTGSNNAASSILTKQMFTNAGASLKDGITIAFKAKDLNSSGNTHQHIFDFSDAGSFNKITGGNFLGGSNTKNYSCFFLECNGRYEGMKRGTEVQHNNSFNSSTAGWHTYSFSLSRNTMTLYKDGSLVAVYRKQGAIDDEWFNQVFLSDLSILGLGISSWKDDPLLNAKISDFCIFSRALTGQEAYAALESLLNAPERYVTNSTNQMYFDSCGSDEKYPDTAPDNAYTTKIYDDPTYGKVLNTNGAAVQSYVPSFNNTDSLEEGYTLSFTINPGSSIDSSNIINIGNKLTITENGTLTFTDGTSTYSTTNIFNNKLHTNTWSNVTLQFTRNFAFERIFVYVDGVPVNTIDTFVNIPSGSTYPSSRIETAVFESGAQIVSYGPANCMLNNVRIFAGCISRIDLFNKEMDVYAAQIIYQRIDEFLAAIKTWDPQHGVVLTNVGAAYKAYDEACRYLDSIKYGDNIGTPSEYAKYANALNLATQTMTDGSFQKLRSGAPYYVNNTAVTQPDYASGILYTTSVGTNNDDNGFPEGQVIKGVTVNVGYGNTVFLYDGTTTTFRFPVFFAGKTNGKNSQNRYIHTVYPAVSTSNANNSLVFTLEGNSSDAGYASAAPWHGVNNDKVLDWSKINSSNKVGWRYDNGSVGKHCSIKYSQTHGTKYNDTTVFYYNTCQFNPSQLNGNGANFAGFTPYEYKDASNNVIDTSAWLGKSGIAGQYILSWAIAGHDSTTGRSYDYCDSQATDGAKVIEYANRKIFVVDDSELLNCLNSAELANNIKNIDTFTSDSAQRYCYIIDALTSIRTDQYNFSDGMSACTKIQYDIDKAVNDYKTAMLDNDVDDLVEKGEYNKLKQDILNENYVEAYDAPDYSLYTSDSINDYLRTYAAVKEHFTNMDPSVTNSQNYLDSDDLTDDATFGGRVDVSYDRLMPKVDYTQLKAINDADGNETLTTVGEDETVTQNYSYKSWLPYDEVVTLTNGVLNNNIVSNGNVMNGLDGNPLVDDGGNALVFGEQNTPAYKYTATQVKNGKTYYVTNLQDPSPQQAVIADAVKEYPDRYAALDPVADYTCYDAATDILSYQDMGAYKTDYINSATSPYGVVSANGTRNDSVTYSNGSSVIKTYNTPGYTSQTDIAYINADSSIYKLLGQSDQTVLDGKTALIVEGLNASNVDNSANRNAYNVTIKQSFNGTETTLTTGSFTYGKLASASVTNGHCYKIVVSTGGKDVELPGIDTYSFNVHADTTVTMYTSTDAVSSGTVKVKVYNMYGVPADEYVVADTSSLVLDNSAYTVNGTQHNVSVPFYTFYKWAVNGKIKDNGSYSVSELAKDGVITLRPDCKPIAGVSATLDGEVLTTVAPDTLINVKVTKDDAYAIALYKDYVYYIVAYAGASGVDYQFYITNDIDLVTIYDDGEGNYYTMDDELILDDMEMTKLANKLPFAYSMSGYSENDGAFIVTSSPSGGSNAGAVITECGTIYANNATGSWTADNLKLGESGVYKVQAKNPDELTNQFYLGLKPKATSKYAVRSYVKYTYNFAAADNNAKVDIIEYGNVCYYNAPGM